LNDEAGAVAVVAFDEDTAAMSLNYVFYDREPEPSRAGRITVSAILHEPFENVIANFRSDAWAAIGNLQARGIISRWARSDLNGPTFGRVAHCVANKIRDYLLRLA
jgi:hypothetical protein